MSSCRKRPAPDDDDGAAKKVKKVHPFFTKSTEPPVESAFMWQKPLGPRASCLYGISLKPKPSTKVAAFDLDGTLIKSSFGKGMAKGKADTHLEWWRPSVPAKLKEVYEQGFAIVIISNQALSPAALQTWKDKIKGLSSALPELPFYLYAATAKDQFRKPMPGMWHELTRIFAEDNVAVDVKNSFFVGDAAGRRYGPKDKDFASTDRKWALNLTIPFYTPEEYFLKLPAHADYVLEGFNISNLPSLPLISSMSTPVVPQPPQQEVVVLVGYPCLGKSSFYARYLKPAGYTHINQDTLGSRPKCIAAATTALSEGKSCVIDNTNRDVQTRKYYIDLATRYKVPIRCFLFTGSAELAWHNNLYRAFNRPSSSMAVEPSRDLLPYIAFSGFKSKYEEPTTEEGFTEVQKVNWVFEGSEEERKNWSMWLQI